MPKTYLRKQSTMLIGFTFGIAFIFSTITAFAKDADETKEGALMGAGAHFAWIVFDALKEDLERATNRETILFGENSMLGVGVTPESKRPSKIPSATKHSALYAALFLIRKLRKNNLLFTRLQKNRF